MRALAFASCQIGLAGLRAGGARASLRSTKTTAKKTTATV